MKRVCSEEGRVAGFIGRSVDTTIRNIICNPTTRKEVRDKMSKTRIERGLAKGANNPRFGKHCTEETKLKMHNAKWKTNSKSNHETYYRTIAKNNIEIKLKRKLEKDEVVHHLDCDISNNSLSNLYLFPNSSTHIKYHIRIKRLIIEKLLNRKWYGIRSININYQIQG